MHSPTHIECSVFTFTRIRNQYIFFKPCKVPTVFPFTNFSCEDCFFFGRSLKRLSADRPSCEQTLLHDYFRRTCFVQTCRPWTAWRTSHKATSFLMQPYVWLARTALRNFTSLFLPATISLASLHKMHICAQH